MRKLKSSCKGLLFLLRNLKRIISRELRKMCVGIIGRSLGRNVIEL